MMFPRCTFTIAAAALLATPLPEKGVRTIFPASGPATSIRQLELLCSPLQITLEGLRAFAWADGALAALAEPPPVVEKIAPAKPGRQYVDFDFDWRFQRGDNPTGFDPELDDTAWRVVQLPHDWSIEGPFGPEYASGTGYAPGGIAWYRKRFTLSPDLEGRQLAVEFDGVYENAEVWINGQLVGRRPYGYSSFQFDLTPYLDFAGENVLAVRVDHSKNADSRWYTGSGIYRHVRLRITDPLAVAHWGTFVTTPQVSDERATVAAETSVDNRHDRRRKVTFRWTILDPNGNQAAATTADATIDANSTANIHTELAIDNPARWSIDSPALYTLRTEVLDGAVPVDSTDTRFGIRTIRFDPDHGFFLNGQNLKLKGVCLHHDAGCLGAAVPAKVLERRLRLMKELRRQRHSHQPQPARPRAVGRLRPARAIGPGRGLRRVHAAQEQMDPRPQRRPTRSLRLRRVLPRVGPARRPGHGPPRPQPPLDHHVEHRQRDRLPQRPLHPPRSWRRIPQDATAPSSWSAPASSWCRRSSSSTPPAPSPPPWPSCA